ncbi:BTB/POZ domain-containing protein 6-like isoform X2 [Mytilus edulis]
MILALRSPVFKAMFYGSFPQSEGDIRIDDISLNTFKELMKYLYTDYLQLTKKSVIPLLYAAQKYMIAGLISKCENYLQDSLAVKNACTLFSHANLFTMTKLRANALKCIADNAIDVLKDDDFLLLLPKDLVEILELDSLCVQEVDVIRAVLKWVDRKLTKSKNKIDGKSRRDVLLKDGILFTMAIPLLSIDEFTSVVIPSGVLTDEEQLQIFKAITIPNKALACGKFRVSPRKGGRVVEVFVNDIVYPGKNRSGEMYSIHTTNIQPENVSVKANKRIKIKSVTLKPQFEQPGPNNCNFKVDFKTVTSMQNIPPRMVDMYDCFEYERNGIGTSEGTLNVKFEGEACKLSIDKVIPESEILVMTIKPDISNENLMWGANQHVTQNLPQTYVYRPIHGMMYEHELSQQTTLYLSLTGGHLVESFEVVEIC